MRKHPKRRHHHTNANYLIIFNLHITHTLLNHIFFNFSFFVLLNKNTNRTKLKSVNLVFGNFNLILTVCRQFDWCGCGTNGSRMAHNNNKKRMNIFLFTVFGNKNIFSPQLSKIIVHNETMNCANDGLISHLSSKCLYIHLLSLFSGVGSFLNASFSFFFFFF